MGGYLSNYQSFADAIIGTTSRPVTYSVTATDNHFASGYAYGFSTPYIALPTAVSTTFADYYNTYKNNLGNNFTDNFFNTQSGQSSFYALGYTIAFYKSYHLGTPPTLPRPVAPIALSSDTANGDSNAALYLPGTSSANQTDYSTAYNFYVQGGIGMEPDATGMAFPGSVIGAGPTSCQTCWVPLPPAPPPSFGIANGAGLVPAAPAPIPITANFIANNPAIDTVNGTPVADFNTTGAANLMPAGMGSFSFNFVAGADFASANPTSVVTPPPSTVTRGPATDPVTGAPTGLSDSVTVNGHTSYTNPQVAAAEAAIGVSIPPGGTIDIPTLVRTGTGSITIAAAGSVELLDTTVPGAIYTAGDAIAGNAQGFTPPPLNPQPNTDPFNPAFGQTVPFNGLVSVPTWAAGGGSVTVTAGADIVGIETPVDSDGSQTGTQGALTGQFWSSWYYFAGQSTQSANNSGLPFNPADGGVQTSAWVNYATFFQGFGALGGGNINLKAGQDIDDISASIPETIQVSGGTTASDPAQENVFGGGNLNVVAGNNIESGLFFVGRGTGNIQAGGSIIADPQNPVTGAATAFRPVNEGVLQASQTVAMLLAEQDGFINVSARGDLTLGGVFDPTTLPLDTFKTISLALPAV